MHFDSHLSGVGEQISLTDLLQLFHYCRKSVLLQVSGPLTGRVEMFDGELYHAQCAEKEGEEALAVLLAQKLVRVRTRGIERVAKQTIRRGFSAVVLSIFQRYDEDKIPLWYAGRREFEPPLTRDIDSYIESWVKGSEGVEHAALIDPRHQYIVGCESRVFWGQLARTSLLQTLIAPYFDESFAELDEILGETEEDGSEIQETMVTVGGRRYLLSVFAEHGLVATLISKSAMASPGLSLMNMASLRRAVQRWSSEQLLEAGSSGSGPQIRMLLDKNWTE